MISLTSWLVFGMWFWSETKTEYVCFLMAYCCPLSTNDSHCNKTWKTDTVAKLPNYSKRNKTIIVRCPSNNSLEYHFSRDSHPLFVSLWVCFQECNCRHSTSETQCAFHLGYVSQTHMWLKYVAQWSNRNRLWSSEVLTCTRWNVPHWHQTKSDRATYYKI